MMIKASVEKWRAESGAKQTRAAARSHSEENSEVESLAGEKGSSFLQDTRGLSTVEYLILLTLIVVACLGAWNAIGKKVETRAGDAQKAIEEKL